MEHFRSFIRANMASSGPDTPTLVTEPKGRVAPDPVTPDHPKILLPNPAEPSRSKTAKALADGKARRKQFQQCEQYKEAALTKGTLDTCYCMPVFLFCSVNTLLCPSV